MPATFCQRIHVIDSHTGGEPTRVVVAGGPDLGTGDLATRRERFRQRHDAFRRTVVDEPRGSNAVVGALLCEPNDPSCTAGVIFFNNVGYLGMCGHGTIGLIVTLEFLGRIRPGEHRIETCAGVIVATLDDARQVTIANVPSFRSAAGVTVAVEGYGDVTGDVAWGGNWFFLVHDHREQLTPANIGRLTDFGWRIRQALARAGITGSDGGEIDHIELFGPPQSAGADSRNFVLCPGKAYDRSPCGTGTSAKLACLVADGKLRPGQVWRQESIIGSVFEAFVTLAGDQMMPHIKGSAHICAEATLLVEADDPLGEGVRL
jgi:4-hydroxyproline epimerase